jgi:hypothetical protein
MPFLSVRCRRSIMRSRLRMARRTADAGHASAAQPAIHVSRDVARSIVGEQPWPVYGLQMIKDRADQS